MVNNKFGQIFRVQKCNISCNTGTYALPDMSGLALRRYTHACVTTITYNSHTSDKRLKV